MKLKSFASLVLIVAVSTPPVLAAEPSVGAATYSGRVSVQPPSADGAQGLSDGAQLSTVLAASEMHLGNGLDVRLAARSSGTAFRDHLVLQQGAVRVAGFAGYPVEARGFEILADCPRTAAVIRVSGNTVEVASLGGDVKVVDGGVMLTRVIAGSRMSFQQNTTNGQNSNANAQTVPPTQTGAAPAAQPVTTGAAKRPRITDRKAFLTAIIVLGVSAAVVGTIAGVQGKNPF